MAPSITQKQCLKAFIPPWNRLQVHVNSPPADVSYFGNKRRPHAGYREQDKKKYGSNRFLESSSTQVTGVFLFASSTEITSNKTLNNDLSSSSTEARNCTLWTNQPQLLPVSINFLSLFMSTLRQSSLNEWPLGIFPALIQVTEIICCSPRSL